MDNQNQRSVSGDQRAIGRIAVTTTPGPAIPNSSNNPKVNVSDEQARALLTLHNLQDSHVQHQSTKSHISLLITLATVVIIVIVASIMLGSLKSKTASNTPSSSSTAPSSTSANTPSNNTTNQINQDVDSCANPVTAVTQC